MMLRTVVGASAVGVAAIVVACVGSDSNPSASGTSSTSSSSGGTVSVDDSGTPIVQPYDAAAPPACDLRQPFGEPTKFRAVSNPGLDEGQLRFSYDGKQVYFARGLHGQTLDLYEATLGGQFKDAFPLSKLNHDQSSDDYPTVSPDNRTLLYASNANGPFTLWQATRTDDTPFGAPAEVALGSDISDAVAPYFTPDGAAVYFSANVANGDGPASAKILRMTKVEGTFAKPIPVTTEPGRAPVVSGDEKTLYFQNSTLQLVRATRVDVLADFSAAEVVGEIPQLAEPNWLSPDGCTLVLTIRDATEGGTDSEIYTATKPPPK